MKVNFNVVFNDRLHRHYYLVTVAILLAALLFANEGYAQNSGLKVTGKVTDNTEEIVSGVSVKVKGTTISAVTDKDGRYTIGVPDGKATLVFTFMGYVAREIPVSNRLQIDVVLTSSSSALEEVVVVGYGSVNKRDLTGSVGQVDMKDLLKAPVASFSEALAGRIAGVQVSSNDGQPGSMMNIVIRGANSLTQDNSPLYVIDGFPTEAEDAILNPDDIETISILKDASSTAIYGARGANGVIVIETKKGKIGTPVITYNGSYGTNQLIKKMDLLSPYEFIKYHNEFNPTLTADRYFTGGRTLESYRDAEGVDWQGRVSQNAPVQIHNFALRGGRGGAAETRYSISGSIYDQAGAIINSGYGRKQGRASFEQTVSKSFRVGVNANYSSIETYGQPVAIGESGSATSNIFYSVWGFRPLTGNGANLEEELFDPEEFSGADLRVNPVINLRNSYLVGKRNDLLANAFIDYSITPSLKFRTTGSIKSHLRRDDRFYNSMTSRGSSRNPNNTMGVNGSLDYQEMSTWLNENTLTYKKIIKKHHAVEVVGGMTLQSDRFEQYGFAAMNVPNEELGISGLDEGTPYQNRSVRSSAGMMSFLGRANYSYRSKYFLSMIFRADGSSKFNPSNRWGYFPSAAVSWRMSAEPFMKNLTFIDDAKLRISYGEGGNNRVGNFSYLPSFIMNTTEGYSFNNGTPLSIITPGNLGNSNLRWETTRQLNIGYDLSLFKSRVQVTAEVYRKTTVDLLLNADLPYTTGYSTVFNNIGSIQNQGFEFTLNTTNVKTKNFTWMSNFNIAFNRNKILSLAENQQNRLTPLRWEFAYQEVPLYIAQVGKPAALFYGYVFDGIYQIEDFNQLSPGVYSLKPGVPNNGNAAGLIRPGDVKYRDINGDGVVNAYDQTTLGNPMPLHVGGFSNNFAYKGFDLNVFFQWSYGGSIYNANRIIFEGERPRPNLNQFATVLDRWTPENRSNTIPRAGGNAPVGTYSSRVIEDGSFLRLKTVQLGYTLPSSFTNKFAVKNLNFNVSAQNIFTWTNYSGMDPEVSVRYSVLTPGFDYAPYPRSLTLVFGLKATL
ncbi:MAG: TonB-dependent receptor [Pedobacter sp.]|nr:MAG: TonB-dependent receptor [Pedobacter sp.]